MRTSGNCWATITQLCCFKRCAAECNVNPFFLEKPLSHACATILCIKNNPSQSHSSYSFKSHDFCQKKNFFFSITLRVAFLLSKCEAVFWSLQINCNVCLLRLSILLLAYVICSGTPINISVLPFLQMYHSSLNTKLAEKSVRAAVLVVHPAARSLNIKTQSYY